MDGQTGHNFPDRTFSRRDRHGGPKEYRISKADIGGPMIKKSKPSPDKMERVILRCVTIQKDEKGYGLTVSGDNPVYVQSVKPNGAAMTAGVLQGDRIYKVNGQNVIESNHIEVVKLIKAANNVTLTLFSPNASSEDSGGAVQELPPLPVTRPHSMMQDNAFHDEKVNTIKKMLNQEKEEVEVESSRQLTNSVSYNHTAGSVADDTDLISEDHVSLEKTKDPVKVQQNIITFEDEELAEESQPSQNHGPFLDFNILKTKPAHAAVFLNYVFHSHDPSHLLLSLMTEVYRQSSATKELNKLSDVIIKTFLSENAPLKVSLDEGIAKSIIDNSQSRGLSDDALRSLFDPAAQHALKTVRHQLEQFCSKREQGLSNCYGEEKVSGNLSDAQVVKAVEDIVNGLIQDLAQLQSGADEAETQKTNAKSDTLERILAHWAGKKKSKISSRLGSMLRPNRPAQPRPWSSASVESIIEEQQKQKSGKFKLPKPKKSNRDSENNDQSHTPLHKSSDSLVVSIDYDDKPPSGKDLKSEKSIRRPADGEIDNTDSDSRTESDVMEVTPESQLRDLYKIHPELDIPPESSWAATAPRQVVKQLDKKETKRQEIINELIQTEQHHVRDLQILSLLFYQSMKDDGGLSQEELSTVFPNLHEILSIHQRLKKSLDDQKTRDGDVVKEIGPVFADMFLGVHGEKFKEACATYCGNQSAALAFIKDKCKKESKFNALIQSIEKHPVCRRLQLKDFIPGEFQRLTKYPLLFENIMKNSKKNGDHRLPDVIRKSKEILKYVDKAIKDAEDIQKVVEIQKNLDSSSLGKVNHPIAQEYKNINLTERKLIHQGPLIWRITNNEKKKSVGLHCVLFEDIMVLLQKQEEKYVLRCHTNSAPNQKDRVQPPILKLSKVYVRSVATDKRAFYVLSASEFGAQIYDLVASTAHEMHEWMKLVSSAIDIAKSTNTPSTPILKPEPEFLIPVTPKPAPAQIVYDEPKVKDGDDVVAVETCPVDDVDIVAKLRVQDNIINTALSEKHRALASYAGVDPKDLESIFEISMEDAFPDRNSLVLHLLSLSNTLASIMNDALNPDTEFLLPTSPHLLTPVPQTTLPNVNSTVADAKTDDVKDLPSNEQPRDSEQSKDNVDDQDVANNSEVPILLPDTQSDQNEVTDIPADTSVDNNSTTKTEEASAELEIAIASDYETASESPSPSADQEPGSSENVPDEQDSSLITNPPVLSEQISDLSTSVATEGVESGIATESNFEKTADSFDIDLASDVLSPMQSETHDLLDFGTHVIMPEDSNSNSSVPDVEKSALLGKTNPINVTKMLKIQRSIHSQLLRLLEILKSEETSQQRLLEDNIKIDSATPPVYSDCSDAQPLENHVPNDQQSSDDAIFIIPDVIPGSPSIQKK